MLGLASLATFSSAQDLRPRFLLSLLFLVSFRIKPPNKTCHKIPSSNILSSLKIMMLLSRTNAALTFALLCLTACLGQSATLQERFTANNRRVLYSSRKLEGEWGNCSTFKCLFVCLVSWPATFFALVRFAWIPHPRSHSSLRLLLLASKQSPSAQTFIHKVTQNLTDPNLTGLDV